MKDNQAALRKHLLYLLRGGGAHIDFDTAIAGLPAKLRGVRPKGVPHTAWRLLSTCGSLNGTFWSSAGTLDMSRPTSLKATGPGAILLRPPRHGRSRLMPSGAT